MPEQLRITGLTKHFGGLVALDGVDLTIEEGELVGLIGPNGSGKSTLLNIISGYYGANAGSIGFDGQMITKSSPYKLARLGIGRSFQVTKVFRRLSVMDNMLVAGMSNWHAKRIQAERQAMRVLDDFQLSDLASRPASDLSGGQAKLLEFARVMMLHPKLILLDEPFGGVHPELKRFMQDRVKAWNRSGVTVILISHDMNAIFGLCGRVITLSQGTIICDGTPEQTRADASVLEAYLGG